MRMRRAGSTTTPVLLPVAAAPHRLSAKPRPASALGRGKIVPGVTLFLTELAAWLRKTMVVACLILAISAVLFFFYLLVTVQRILRHAFHRK